MRPSLCGGSKFRSHTQFQSCHWECLFLPFSPWSLTLFALSYRMTRWTLLTPLLLGLFIHSAISQEAEDSAPPPPPGQAPDGTQEDNDDEWGLNSIRGSFESVSGYFDSMLEFMGGRDGVCQYRCRYGELASRCMASNQNTDIDFLFISIQRSEIEIKQFT